MSLLSRIGVLALTAGYIIGFVASLGDALGVPLGVAALAVLIAAMWPLGALIHILGIAW